MHLSAQIPRLGVFRKTTHTTECVTLCFQVTGAHVSNTGHGWGRMSGRGENPAWDREHLGKDPFKLGLKFWSWNPGAPRIRLPPAAPWPDRRALQGVWLRVKEGCTFVVWRLEEVFKAIQFCHPWGGRQGGGSVWGMEPWGKPP